MLISVTFIAFGMSSVRFIKLFGIGMALAVLMDAFVIRGTLVPAFMRLAGNANWWLPEVPASLVRAVQDQRVGREREPAVAPQRRGRRRSHAPAHRAAQAEAQAEAGIEPDERIEGEGDGEAQAGDGAQERTVTERREAQARRRAKRKPATARKARALMATRVTRRVAGAARRRRAAA